MAQLIRTSGLLLDQNGLSNSQNLRPLVPAPSALPLSRVNDARVAGAVARIGR
jgi:hypothetical protein